MRRDRGVTWANARRLIGGLGIPGIGQIAGKQLAEVAATLDELVSWSPAEVREKVGAIHGFGSKMVDAVVAFLQDPAERRILEKLRERRVGRAQPKHDVAAEGPLAGKSFCVTGVLTRKRDDVHALLRAAGAAVHDSVRKDTTFLVAGDKTGKTKLDQARKFGAKVISEEEMDALLAGAV